MEKKNFAQLIDHTLLKPDADIVAIENLCKEAVKYGFWSVCIEPCWVLHASTCVKGSGVRVCTVIGFPLGANLTEVKVFETKTALENGASEIDMVINVGFLKSKHYEYVLQDIQAVKGACKNALLKVIIETSLLTDDEKVLACTIAKEAGADFVKTSTGFSGGGATPADITLMRKTVGTVMGVKASGGVRTYEDAVKMYEAGASRLGTSAGVSIVS